MRVALFDTDNASSEPAIHIDRDSVVVHGHLDPVYDLPSDDIPFSEVIVKTAFDSRFDALRPLIQSAQLYLLTAKPSTGTRRLDIEAGGTVLTFRWNDGDTLPPPVGELRDALERLRTELPEQQWRLELMDRCRTLSEQLFGDNINFWRPVRQTHETFDAYLDAPHSHEDPALAGVRLQGERIVLHSGDKFLAFHAADHRIVLAETWKAHELPTFPPALVDFAASARKTGDADRALALLARASVRASTPELSAQIRLESAELLVRQKHYDQARQQVSALRTSPDPIIARLAEDTLEWIDGASLQGSAQKAPPFRQMLHSGGIPWWRVPQVDAEAVAIRGARTNRSPVAQKQSPETKVPRAPREKRTKTPSGSGPKMSKHERRKANKERKREQARLKRLGTPQGRGAKPYQRNQKHRGRYL